MLNIEDLGKAYGEFDKSVQAGNRQSPHEHDTCFVRATCVHLIYIYSIGSTPRWFLDSSLSTIVLAKICLIWYHLSWPLQAGEGVCDPATLTLQLVCMSFKGPLHGVFSPSQLRDSVDFKLNWSKAASGFDKGQQISQLLLGHFRDPLCSSFRQEGFWNRHVCLCIYSNLVSTAGPGQTVSCRWKQHPWNPEVTRS